MAIRVLMLDLGETLVHGNQALPHVPEALEAIGKMKAGDGSPLESCLVSDFTMPTAPVTPPKIAALFDEYLTLLEGFGLRRFFEPVERRVTLSTQAGHRKPDREIFEEALERLGVPAGLAECLFITEDVAHLQKASTELGMATLRFGSSEGFTDWAEGPLLIAAKLAGPEPGNVAVAAKAWLRTRHGLEGVGLESRAETNTVAGSVKQWSPLPGEQGEALHVPLARPVKLQLDAAGRVASMSLGEPDPEVLEEAAHFVKTLRANHQLADSSGAMPAGTTHRIVVDAQGRRVLQRQRFSAI